jgi:hypothetical protein
MGPGPLWTALAALLSLAAGAPPTPAPPGRALSGEWGGDHIALTFNEGSATLQFDCAGGSMDIPVVPDASGRFEVAGLFWRLMPVVRQDIAPAKRPARWKGETDGKIMKLTGTIVEDGTDLGTFELERGRPPRLRRCA